MNFTLTTIGDAMKTLRRFFVLGAVLALVGLNTMLADGAGAANPLTFRLDTGYPSVNLPEISFDSAGSPSGEETQSTCAMTPGGNMPNLIPNQPVVPPTNPGDPDSERNAARSPETTLDPNLTDPVPVQHEHKRYWAISGGSQPLPEGDDGDVPSPAVPEPATLVIVGLGIGAAAIARRRWKK